MAMASAATLVAAQCVEAAEAMGAEREHLEAAVGSAVNVRTPGDIVTVTAAAATALRGAATLKARALKEVWNIAAVIPVEKGTMGGGHHHKQNVQKQHRKLESNGSSISDDLSLEEENNFLGICSQELLARGTELLKRTRAGALHWKAVSVYINRMGLVTLKMKSRHVVGTITKKKKSVIIDVCKDVAAWPGRHLLEDGEHRRYFGLRTADHRVIEFECTSQREHEMWTKGVARLLIIAAERKRAFLLCKSYIGGGFTAIPSHSGAPQQQATMGIAPVATYHCCSSYSLARPPAAAGAARAHVAAAAISSRASSFVAGGGLAVAAASAAVAGRPRTAGSGGGAMGCKCLFGLGVPELVVIAGVAALVFGPKKLPEIGRSIGKTVNSFQQVYHFIRIPVM
ncbi:hypothetical protein GUJ93_ZPchr0013g35246 [Zizania palustris]|uniref:PH domain-containing protein n=1 Tax=Zizania palustris TaxID=103762 RepID=A0A8J5WXQ5_ZIZPA|nr:hypothetical protein GUJ93_ZPchr0013g35246 [Zizania palustris]